MSPFPDDDLANPRRAAADAAHAARDAARAARHAARSVHRARFRARCQGSSVFFGALLIGLGLLFLLDNLNIIEARYFFRNFWPLLIIGFGLSRMVFGQGGERVFGAIATTFGGLWLADRLLDLDINVVGLFWPIILIGLGLNILFNPNRSRWMRDFRPPPLPPLPPLPGFTPPHTPPHTPYAGFTEGGQPAPEPEAPQVDQSASIREVAILAGIERRNVSQTFRGGTITSVMGSVELDLRDCRMVDATASIWVQVIMGQVVLRLPPNWTVESRLATVLGSLEDRSDRPVETSPKRLIVDGSVFLGQIEIRN